MMAHFDTVFPVDDHIHMATALDSFLVARFACLRALVTFKVWRNFSYYYY